MYRVAYMQHESSHDKYVLLDVSTKACEFSPEIGIVREIVWREIWDSSRYKTFCRVMRIIYLYLSFLYFFSLSSLFLFQLFLSCYLSHTHTDSSSHFPNCCVRFEIENFNRVLNISTSIQSFIHDTLITSGNKRTFSNVF